MSDPITWLEPVAVDNSNEEPAMATTHRPGSTFPLGVTTVTYRFTDGAGNVASCMFQVSVIGNFITIVDECCMICNR